MSAARFFTDEDIYAAVAPALRKIGVDAVSTPESGRLGQSDGAQLEWAAANGRAIVTFNVAHFAAMHDHWMSQGRRHSGIIVSSQRPIGELIRRVTNLSAALSAEALQDRLEFLGDW